ncbi:Transposase IS200 like protein [Mucilaginibacter xinganensis]|uniref:Transposase IS200 like protein n=2 Tax=Mucilaginibacter xinganensis TaxID=1234841 RepID=A0A223P163_9SPHI|nr:Transposase IS200 like protein [Mucilaginibacter xinganensis]
MDTKNLSVPLKLKTIAIFKIKAHIYFMSRNASTDELYFATFTVVDWIDVLTRREYSDFIIENLQYCQQHKNLNVYAYVIITNHIHLVANVRDGSLGEVLGRFKSYTSKKLFELIANNAGESRREWMIKAFEHAGKYNPLNENHQFWQNGNYPVLLYSPAVIDQKIDYIHENPVKAGFVGAAHDYWYSSSNPESPLKIIY